MKHITPLKLRECAFFLFVFNKAQEYGEKEPCHLTGLADTKSACFFQCTISGFPSFFLHAQNTLVKLLAGRLLYLAPQCTLISTDCAEFFKTASLQG